MAMSPLPPDRWAIQELVPDTCIEWRLPKVGLLIEDQPIEEKESVSFQGDSLRILHFAPGSWLVINGEATVPPASLPSGLIGVDVTGKWIGFWLDGPQVESVLRTEVQLGIVLAARQCAATSMFDCPVLIHRAGHQFELWVQASYSDHLRTRLSETAHRFTNQPDSPSQTNP